MINAINSNNFEENSALSNTPKPTHEDIQPIRFPSLQTNFTKPFEIFHNESVSAPSHFKMDKKGNKFKTNPIKDMNMSKANFKREMRTSKSNQDDRTKAEHELSLLMPHKRQTVQKSVPSIANLINVKNSLEKPYKEEIVHFGGIKNKGTDGECKIDYEIQSEKINHLPSTNEEENETSSESAKSSDSGYIVFGDTYDFFVECCYEESLFIDIHDIKKNFQDYEIIKGNDNIMMEIEQIVLPKRNQTRLGEPYQAQIPQLTRNSSHIKSLCLIWSPDAVQPEFIEEYIRKLSLLTGVPEEDIVEERAIDILNSNNLDLLQTLKFCYANLGYIRNRIMIRRKKMLL